MPVELRGIRREGLRIRTQALLRAMVGGAMKYERQCLGLSAASVCQKVCCVSHPRGAQSCVESLHLG